MKKAGADTEGIPNWIEYRVPRHATSISQERFEELEAEFQEMKKEQEEQAKIPFRDLPRETQKALEKFAKECGWDPKKESYEEYTTRAEAERLLDPSRWEEDDWIDDEEWDYKKSW
jgi:hypothetical protein